MFLRWKAKTTFDGSENHKGQGQGRDMNNSQLHCTYCSPDDCAWYLSAHPLSPLSPHTHSPRSSKSNKQEHPSYYLSSILDREPLATHALQRTLHKGKIASNLIVVSRGKKNKKKRGNAGPACCCCCLQSKN
jgi:hypothetical protein